MLQYNQYNQSNKIAGLRSRPQIPRTSQEKKILPQSPVEFKDDLLPVDTPKLIFGGASVSPMNSGHLPITPQHEENIKFASEEWERVRCDLNNSSSHQLRKGCIQYVERQEYKNPPNFKPFDLEEFWGQRMLKRAGVPQQNDQ